MDDTGFVDFIVVGGGTSGCVLASRIARSSAKPRVLLLEAGGDNSDIGFRMAGERFTAMSKYSSELDYGYKTTPQKFLKGREIPYARGKGLGGSTAINSCAWDYGSPEELNRWSRLVGDNIWKWDNSSKILKDIENIHHDGTPEWQRKFVGFESSSHGNNGPVDITLPTVWEPGLRMMLEAASEFGLPISPDMCSSNSIGLGSSYSTTYKGTRTTAASAYLTNKPENLIIRTDCQVIRVLVENGRAVAVETYSGEKYFARNDIILSAGSFDTPKILLLSGIGAFEELAKHNIPKIVDLPGIGRNLRDHPLVRVQFGMTADSIPAAPNVNIEGSRELWFKNRTGPLGSDNGSVATGYFKLASTTTCPEFSTLPQDVQELLSNEKVPAYELGMRIYPAGSNIVAHLDVPSCNMTVILMNGQSLGSVTLKSGHPKDPPVIDVNYLSHPFDRRIMIDAVRAGMEFLESSTLPIADMIIGPKSKSDEDILDFMENNVNVSWHAMGTAKMGRPKDEGACVDTEFRVFGVEKLRIVDMSIAPLVINNHTQSTAYLIGEIAARKIIDEYELEKST